MTDSASSSSTTPSVADVLIVGGGYAGLSAANTLVRHLHSVVVFDSNQQPRGHGYIHSLPTWDARSPAEYRAAARKELVGLYDTCRFVDREVKAVKKTPEGRFEATDSNGQTWVGRKVILAHGVVDKPVDIPGYAECWPDVLFYCTLCQALDFRGGASSGVLATGDLASGPYALHMARSAAIATPAKVTIYTNGNSTLKAELEGTLQSSSTSNITVDDSPIARLERLPAAGAAEGTSTGTGTTASQPRITLHFSEASTPAAVEAFLVHKPPTELRGDLGLGLQRSATSDFAVSPPFNQTGVPGVFAAGDNATPMKMISHALYSGALAGAGASAQLVAEAYGHPSMV